MLDALEPEAIANLSARDLRRLGVRAGDRMRVTTRRGSIELKARVDGAIPPGMVFIPFCYAEAAANLLTNPQLDPFGKIPEFKFCAARVEPVRGAGGRGGVGLRRQGASFEARATREHLRMRETVLGLYNSPHAEVRAQRASKHAL